MVKSNCSCKKNTNLTYNPFPFCSLPGEIIKAPGTNIMLDVSNYNSVSYINVNSFGGDITVTLPVSTTGAQKTVELLPNSIYTCTVKLQAMGTGNYAGSVDLSQSENVTTRRFIYKGNLWVPMEEDTILYPTEQLGNKTITTAATMNTAFGELVAHDCEGYNLLSSSPRYSSFTGRVTSFQKDFTTGIYTQGTDLIPDDYNSGTTQQYGYALSVSKDGKRAVTTAQGMTSANPGNAWIWINQSNTGVWTQETENLYPLIAAAAFPIIPSQFLGASCAINETGTIAVIGDPETSGSTGRAYVLSKRKYSTWKVATILMGLNLSNGAQFGFSCAISNSGDKIAIGSPYDSTNLGSTHIYTYDGYNGYYQSDKLIANDISSGGQQGFSVAFNANGETLVVGAVGVTVDSVANAGMVTVYQADCCNKKYVQYTGSFTATDLVGSSQYGSAVAVSDNGRTIAVGGEYDNGASPSGTGASWIHTRKRDGTWVQKVKFNGSDAVSPSRQGCTVALTRYGGNLVHGGCEDNTYTGAFWRWG